MKNKLPDNIKIIEKIDFEKISAIFDVLSFSFLPDEIKEDEDFDERFLTLWKLSLMISGWDEEDFWEEHNKQAKECACEKCECDDCKTEEKESKPN